MKRTILRELLRQKGDPCLTIIVPTEIRSFDDREKIELKLKKAMTDARKQLDEDYHKSVVETLIKNIEILIGQIDMGRLQKGVGLFATTDYKTVVYFPFEIHQRIVINSSFDIRDVIANLNKLTDYNVLQLSQGHTRLFRGSGNRLKEVKNGHFPQRFEDEFQKARVRPAGPGHQFYKGEESKIDQARLDSFLRTVDEALEDYQVDEPLLVLGTNEMISSYKRVSQHRSQIIGEVEGNYDHNTRQQIAELSWPRVEEYRKKELEQVIEKAKDALYINRAVSGLQQVYEIAKQGRGSQLLVERDYVQKAFKDPKHDSIVLGDEPHNVSKKVPDAIEEVMDILVGQKDTGIFIVDNEELKEYGRIILTTRY